MWSAQKFFSFLFCFLFLTSAFGTLAYAQTDERIDNETEISENSTAPALDYSLPEGLQTELPQQDPRDIAPRERKKERNRSGAGAAGMALFFKVIFFGLFGLALIALITTIAREALRMRRSNEPKTKSEKKPAVPVYQVDEEVARVLMDDADVLASQGKFEEAVHLLLFRSIQDIADKRPHHVKRSLTAREISLLPILTEKAQLSFSIIGQLVENSFFGGADLNSEDYEKSKLAYKDFAFEKIAR